MKSFATLAALLLAGACSGVAPRPTAAPTIVSTPSAPPSSTPLALPSVAPYVEAPLPNDTAARLQEVLDDYIALGGTPSISAAVIVPGTGTWASAVGLAEVTAAEPATPETVYAMGSITKTYTAALIMLLAEAGELDLDDAAADHLGALAASKANGATVRQLLGHRSGIFNYTDDTQIFEDRPWTVDEVLELVGAPRFEPGERFEYSNTNYLLLGLVAEAVSDRPLTDLLREYLFEPLDLDRTLYGPGEIAPEPVAHGYTAGDVDVYDASGVLPNANLASAAVAAGAMSASARDIARWLFSLYSGRVLTDESLAQMLDFRASMDYGLGVGLVAFPRGRVVIGHDGGIPGFISSGYFDRRSGVVVVVLTNGESLDVFGIVNRLFIEATSAPQG